MNINKSTGFKLFIRKIVKSFEHYLFLIKSHVSPRQFLYISSVLVGISSALAVIFLKTFAHGIFTFSQYVDGYLHLPYSNSTLPILGIILTVWIIKKGLDGTIEKGTSQIMYAVAKKGGILPKKQMYAQIITSSLTVGMGGSAGLESPITITGAAFGSNFAQKYRLTQQERILLLACGVAGGISAAFNAPIAGVLFAIEVVLADISITAFIPLMISAATGSLVSAILLKEDILLSFKNVSVFDYHNLPFYIILGVFSGLLSIYYARIFRRLETFFSKFKNSRFRKALFGATLLGGLIFLFPTLFGEGYESIKILAESNPEKIMENTLLEMYSNKTWVLLLFVSVTMLVKVFATGLTIGSGGNGGNFAPSLFVGSYLGFSLATMVNMIGITKPLPVANFTMVGMAGILSGLFHAPLTAIFLIAEITGGYELMVPLMLVSSVSFAISKRYEEFSFDIKHLADSGDVYTSNKDKNILTSIIPMKLVQTTFHSIDLSPTLENLMEKVKTSHQEIFPVVNEKQELLGVIDINDIRSVLYNSFQIKFTKVEEVMQPPKEIIFYLDDTESIIEKFDVSQKTTLIVLHHGKVYGLLHKSAVYEEYREQLKSLQIQ